MRTDIYLHKEKDLCAIVKAEEGYKFVDNIEKFCPDWQSLIAEAKKGFDGFPFYDRYRNYDVDFWDRYLDIDEGVDDDYEYLGCVDDGIVSFNAVLLKDKGEYFRTLLKALRVSEIYGFCDIRDIVYTDNYIILSSDCEVMACAKIKIPFEPKLEQKALRELMRTKVKELRPFGGQVLHAKYGCSASEISDIENALFYNIGTAAFGAVLCEETSVYFERVQPNEIRGCEDMEFQYFYHYFWEPRDNCKYWWEKECICEWNHVPLRKINSMSKATDYYLAIKNQPDLVTCFGTEGKRALGLKLQLYIPNKLKFSNVVSVMKPIIDGAVCAFHAPVAEIQVEEVSRRLGVNRNVFLSEEMTCLGGCCYVSPYRKSVKWNPKDERLDYVFIESVIVDDEASFSGQIFAIPCYM